MRWPTLFAILPPLASLAASGCEAESAQTSRKSDPKEDQVVPAGFDADLDDLCEKGGLYQAPTNAESTTIVVEMSSRYGGLFEIKDYCVLIDDRRLFSREDAATIVPRLANGERVSLPARVLIGPHKAGLYVRLAGRKQLTGYKFQLRSEHKFRVPSVTPGTLEVSAIELTREIHAERRPTAQWAEKGGLAGGQEPDAGAPQGDASADAATVPPS